MLSQWRGGILNKEVRQALVFLIFFLLVIVNNAVDSVIGSNISMERAIQYTIPLGVFCIAISPILFLPKKQVSMFILLYLISIVSIAITETGTFTTIFAAHTTIYALRNKILPKNIVFRFFLAYGLLAALGYSIYHSTNQDPTAFLNDALFYIACTLIFGFEYGFGKKNISLIAYGITDQERDYMILIPAGMTQPELATCLDVSVRRVQDIGRSARKKAGVFTDTGLVKWASDNGVYD